jgi:4-oxalomesaconate tautomerase
LVKAADGETDVRIHMVNTKSLAVAHVQTPGGRVRYDGTARIDGVPGTHAPIPIDFLDVAGSSCGALLPTGNPRDTIQGISVTCIDNGMPVVVMRAGDFGKTGYESPKELEADVELKHKVEMIRLKAGVMMNLGDVSKKTVPKMCLIEEPRAGGTISTRSFIPHRVHDAIGVFGAVSVATACVLPGSVTEGIAMVKDPSNIEVEHPTGFFTVAMDVSAEAGAIKVKRSALLRTARLLMRGEVFIPSSVWGGP